MAHSKEDVRSDQYTQRDRKLELFGILELGWDSPTEFKSVKSDLRQQDMFENELPSMPSWRETQRRGYLHAFLTDATIACAYCGARVGVLNDMHLDRINPTGRYNLDNIVPACPACNIRRGSVDAFTFARADGVASVVNLRNTIVRIAAYRENGGTGSGRHTTR